MINKQITIIGGHGQMGSLFSRLFSSQGYKVNKLGSKDWQNADSILANTDLAIVSVPINQTAEIIQRTAKMINSHCILADFTSIKVDPILTMLKCHQGPVIGLHPMFGPTISSSTNQVIVYCEGRMQSKCQWLVDLLVALGFTLKPMQASEHDLAMNFIQGVEHFLTFSLGSFLHNKKQHPEHLLEIASPIYLAKLLLMGRIFDQDPSLYADIIMASESRLSLIKEFAAWLNGWITQLETYDKQAFIDEFTKVSKWMGKFTDYSQKVSDNFLSTDFTSITKD